MSDVILNSPKAGESTSAKQPRLYIHCWMKLIRESRGGGGGRGGREEEEERQQQEEEEGGGREREREKSTYLPGLRAEGTVRVDWFVGVATFGLTPTIEGRKQNWIWCALSVPGEELEGVCCHCCSFLCARPFALG